MSNYIITNSKEHTSEKSKHESCSSFPEFFNTRTRGMTKEDECCSGNTINKIAKPKLNVQIESMTLTDCFRRKEEIICRNARLTYESTVKEKAIFGTQELVCSFDHKHGHYKNKEEIENRVETLLDQKTDNTYPCKEISQKMKEEHQPFSCEKDKQKKEYDFSNDIIAEIGKFLSIENVENTRHENNTVKNEITK
ncbi:uncharacterized protein LOC111617918, partial [Centruroides sculpturatus]|uniref:uncharacterized protein LOC111617918 n=1 Tax=Centruroides sculpturatus TaxID=218467 RepID=UPI000C6D8A2B